jgi:hypothetical protein
LDANAVQPRRLVDGIATPKSSAATLLFVLPMLAHRLLIEVCPSTDYPLDLAVHNTQANRPTYIKVMPGDLYATLRQAFKFSAFASLNSLAV